MSQKTAEPMSPATLREIADYSPPRCHDALEWAADEIERLQAIDREFHNIDDIVEIRRLSAEVKRLQGFMPEHDTRMSYRCITCGAFHLQDDVPEGPKPCEHLRSELLAEKQKYGEPLFQMRKCLDCEKTFRVRTSVTRTP